MQKSATGRKCITYGTNRHYRRQPAFANVLGVIIEIAATLRVSETYPTATADPPAVRAHAMTMNFPKISVITVSYNQGEFIKKNIDSVLAQNYPNFEHIVVDGGSTDSTLDVLRSYSHLAWTSEPDRGQSDALNKGFSRATGDIMVWLNSDDWLAENVFHDLAYHLQDYPVVMGQAAETDREGNIRQIVRNPARTFYDMMRYWIPYAWLAQTSVFFKRSLLEEVKRPDGTYLDEDLYFTMDLDLWMRMAKRYPFTKHIDRVLSYYRIYDTNKTGAHPNATQREVCRNFRRHVNGENPTEHRLSYIIPVMEPTELLKPTIISLTQQSFFDFDIVLVDYASERATSRAIHDLFLAFVDVVPQITIRYVKAEAPNECSAFNSGVRKAAAPTVAFLQPGDTVAATTTFEAIQIFARDVVGLVLPTIKGRSDLARFFPPHQGINAAECISGAFFYPNIFARRLALLELDIFRQPENPAYAIKELLTRLLYRGWSVQPAPQLEVTPVARDYSRETSCLENYRDQIARDIILALKNDFESDPFSETRAQAADPRPLINALTGAI
jgi:GT2 family glycosyltransferase